MENKEYAELPEPDVRRLAIESGLIRKADSLRPTTWGRILRFARSVQALRASNGQAPAATVIKKGADRQWMSERLGHLPDGIYSLYLAPTAQPAPAAQAADSVLEDVAPWIDLTGCIRNDAAQDGSQAKGMRWAASRWKDEVENRPLSNIHRRTLDDVWRQVVRYFGGIPSALLGPSHDELLDAARKQGANHD